MGGSYKNLKDYEFLNKFIGKIVVFYAADEHITVQWQKQRDKYLYSGKITNQNVRQIMANEIIIEFDSIEKDIEPGNPRFKIIREESDKWIEAIKERLIIERIFFRITDHKGKSPHIRLIIDGLEMYDKKHYIDYKLDFVYNILNDIQFKSDLITLDRSLIATENKMLSLENKPHFKRKYNGEVEKVIYENINGEIPQIDVKKMTKMIEDYKISIKTDNDAVREEDITLKEVNIEGLKEFWKQNYKSPMRNAYIMALGGICRRKGLNFEDSKQILKILLEYINELQWIDIQYKEMSYSFDVDKKDVAVYSHIKNRGSFSDQEAKRIYKNLVTCFKIKKTEKPQICLPLSDKLISEFALELINHIKDKNELFYKVNQICVVKIENNSFMEMGSSEFITYIEKYVIPGNWAEQKNEAGKKEWVYVKKSMSKETAKSVLESDVFKKSLPKIQRIFTVPMPILYNGKLTFPIKGYDERFDSWLLTNSPEIQEGIELEEAKKILLNIYDEFCFKEEQDRTNAIAALITPFIRGLYPRPTCRTPIFFYEANRERAGKDYAAGITGIVYEGVANEEPPISSDDNNKTAVGEELRKKIMSSLRSGRKRLHFSNNRGHLSNAVIESFSTSEQWTDRVLGKNEEITFGNEMEISLSANAGLTYTSDFANRCRKIKLFLAIEDANARHFKNPTLHQDILNNRSKILGAIYTLIQNWVNNGMSSNITIFSSFSEWARICGGIMQSAKLGDPCIADRELLSIGGDTETKDFKRFFELCYEKHPEKWINKGDLKDWAQEFQGSESIFSYYNFEDRSSQVKFALRFEKYVGRILSGIKMIKAELSSKASKHQYMFTGENSLSLKSFVEEEKKEEPIIIESNNIKVAL